MDMLNTRNANKYLVEILKPYKFNVRELLKIRAKARSLYPLIHAWAKPYPIRIYESGSFAKNTNIKGSTDIDFLLSLPSSIEENLKEIFNSLYQYLKRNRINSKKQKVSIGLNYSGIKIDLVPAKRQPGKKYEHSIYNSSIDSWMKTNIHKHILKIKSAKKQDEIKLIKIWRNCHDLEFPSLLLELAVLEALKGLKPMYLPQKIMKIFEYLSFSFDDARIIDPSNSNNVISEDISDDEKESICSQANESLNATSWIHIVW